MFDETMTKDEILNWVKTRLNFSCGDMHNNLIPFNVQQFNEFDLAYHSDYMDSAGLWGFKNANGEVVCMPKFLFEPFCFGKNYIVCVGSGWEHYAELPEDKMWSKEMHWGLINDNFETVIPFEYDEVECVSDFKYDDNNEIIPNEIDYFVCRKYNEDKNKFYVESEVRDSKNKLIISGYSDVDYHINYNQLVVYKERKRWWQNNKSGYAGVYDFSLNKEIIKPDKYHHIEIEDYNLFLVSDDVENYSNGTLINEKGIIIGEEKIWDQVCHTFNDSKKYKYQASTMDRKYYVFNIKDNKIVDQLEIICDEFLNKY